jgi:release factor glutamine methyltransferase
VIYEPKEDSFLLQKYVKKFASEKSVLDMGTGSGIQAEAAMDAMAEHVLAVDIDVKSVDKLSTRDYEVRRSDLFSRVDEKFDLIIFNPPYLPQNPDEDSESARATTGGVKGDEIMLDFLNQ